VRIHIRLFGTLGRDLRGHDPLKGLDVDLPSGTTVEGLIAHLQIELSKVGMVSVNRKLVDQDFVLSPADDVRIFRPIFGG
jgi:sulfur carrier protein ThiS